MLTMETFSIDTICPGSTVLLIGDKPSGIMIIGVTTSKLMAALPPAWRASW